MLSYPQIDPVALALGPVKVHWYGLMYLIGFAAVYFLGQKRAQTSWSVIKPEAIEDLVTYGAMGVILGGRIGYILFYNFTEFLQDPIILIKIWQGGMSFHGGLLGVLLALYWFAKNRKTSFLVVSDLVAPLVPFGLAFGRLGNFINGELWGRPTDLPWAMVFPLVDSVP